LLVYGDAIRPVNLGTRIGFCDIAATIAEWFGVPDTGHGKSFASEVTK
jgi:phosphopentomutase